MGSGPLLLPWRPHPDAAAAARAGRRSESVCRLEERRKKRGEQKRTPPHHLCPDTATSKAQWQHPVHCGYGGLKPRGGWDLSVCVFWGFFEREKEMGGGEDEEEEEA